LSSEQPLSSELYGHFSACARQIRPTAVIVTAAGKDPNRKGNTKQSVTTSLTSLETGRHKNGIVRWRMGPLMTVMLAILHSIVVWYLKESNPLKT